MKFNGVRQIKRALDDLKELKQDIKESKDWKFTAVCIAKHDEITDIILNTFYSNRGLDLLSKYELLL